jgi:hypothetical protein
MDGSLGARGARGAAWCLAPCSPTTYVFLLLLAIVITFIAKPDIDHDISWILLLLFAVLALAPDTAKEE